MFKVQNGAKERRFDLSGRPDLNRRPSSWKEDILPLNYSRKVGAMGFEPTTFPHQYFRGGQI